MNNTILIAKLIELRKANSFSLAFVAKRLNMPVKDYMAIENGSKTCSKSVLKKIAEMYEIDMEDLTDDSVELEYRNVDLTDSLKLTDIHAEEDGSNRRRLYFVIGAVVVILCLIGLMSIQTEDEILLTADPLESISASNTTVALVKNNGGLRISGLYDYYDVQVFNDIIKVEEHEEYTVGLDKYGYLAYDDNALNNLPGIDDLGVIRDFALGDNHMLYIDVEGNVGCIGNNSRGQCDIDNWENVVEIYAYGNGSVGITEDERCLSIGNIVDMEMLNNLSDVKKVAFSDTILVYLNSDNEVTALNDNAKSFALYDWEDIVDVKCGTDYIIGLTDDKTVKLAIDDYQLTEAVQKWNNIIAIGAADNYLVATDGKQVFGIGENEYGQFIETNIDTKVPQLSRVSNITVEIDYDFVRIFWDKVENADYYSVQVNAGTGFSSKVMTNSIVIDTSKFTEGREYFIKITSLSDSINYMNSDITEKTFVYNAKKQEVEEPTPTPTSDPINIPSIIKLEKLTGKTRTNFEVYMNGLGVLRDNLTAVQDETVICDGEEEVVLSVDGVSDYEEVVLEDLKEIVITYTYCKLPASEPEPTPDPTPEPTPEPTENPEGEE